MAKLNVAIVGCGYVANDHLKAWRKVRQAQVVAVLDINENLARTTAEHWKVPRYYNTLSNLLTHCKVDLVDICTPPQTHSAIAVEAMEAGVNVLIEKPMTMTVTDAEKIVKCQRINRVKAGVIHNWLFDDPVLQAEAIIKEGKLGEIFHVEIEALNTKNDFMAANKNHWCHKLPGGRFSEMLAHPIYLLRHFLGEIEVCDVQVSKLGDYPWMKFDELCATFKGGKKLGRAYASFNSSRDTVFINIYGREGILKLELINSTVNFLPKRKASRFNKGFDSLRQASQLVKSTTASMLKVVSGRWRSGHDTCIKLFADSLINDQKPPVTVEDGFEVVKLLEKICNMIEKAYKKLNAYKIV
jgi:predicted dehydrogenase